jgi:ABC-2 type transport system permease protein
VIETASEARRSRQAGIDPALFDRISRPVSIDIDERELLPKEVAGDQSASRRGAGADASAREGFRIATGSGLAVFLFVLVMTGAGRLLNGMLEEKMGRVGELMLGVVTGAELVAGKLLAGTLVTVLLAAIYVGGALGLLIGSGHSPDFVSPALILCFFVLLTLQTAMVGSACLAVGAACGDFRDTQNLLSPLIAVITLPLIALPAVIRDPSSSLSVALTLFPPSMPAVLLVRVSSASTPPPAWQMAIALLGGVAAVGAGVWAAAKVLRMGLLSHGKGASLRNLVQWLLEP